MKVLHVVSSLNVGGAERFVIDLAQEQNQDKKITPAILSMGQLGEPLDEEISLVGIELFHATKILELRQILKSFNIVHVHSSFCLLRILLSCFFRDVKVVYTRHNERVHKSIKWRFVYFLAYLKLQKIVFVAEKAKENYLRSYPKFTPRAVTILNGVLPMKKNKFSSSSFRISHVGRFVPLKSQHVLIEAVSKLTKQLQDKIIVNFYGTGDLLKNNELLAQKLVPNVTINFKGFVINRNDIYQNTDILVVTSQTEGLSLAVLESLASGTPVIASNVGGNPELVMNEHNGFLYEYNDSAALAEKISLLSYNKTLYETFSKESINHYESNFSMAKCASQYFNSYSC